MTKDRSSNWPRNNGSVDMLGTMVDSIVGEGSGSLGTSGISPSPHTPSNWYSFPIPAVEPRGKTSMNTSTASVGYNPDTSTVCPAHVSRTFTYEGQDIMTCKENTDADICFMSIRLPNWHHINLQFPTSAVFEPERGDFFKKVTAEDGLHWKDHIHKEWPDESKPTLAWLEATVGCTLGAYYDEVNVDRRMRYLPHLLNQQGNVWKSAKGSGIVECMGDESRLGRRY
ncbi:hypothetical protein L204_105816 [Cryptococcus depauperatus]|nr:hypothetical protein L204_06086 [Cryptococcus depauperatus CBS 7855]